MRNIHAQINYIFQETEELENSLNMGRLVQKFLPKQTDIDKILKLIQQKVLNGTHLPVMIKEIEVGYLFSSYYKDIYLYLAQNKLPSNKAAIKKIEVFVEKYILFDSLSFKIVTNPNKDAAVLAILEA